MRADRGKAGAARGTGKSPKQACWICLGPMDGTGKYHVECLRELLGTTAIPTAAFDRKDVPSLIEGQVDRISISGVQAKVLVDLSPDRKHLVVDAAGRYILKPQIDAFAHGPENEHLTMRLASLAGIPVPPCGLVALRDGSTAYIVRRFERTHHRPPRKLLLEDFCSLLGRDPAAKYSGTDEECAEVVRKNTIDPGTSLRRLLRQLAFSFWTSNGDLHLKNLSLLEVVSGGYELSPAYDLLCTWVYPKYDRKMAISINGRDMPSGRSDFVAFGARGGISESEVGAILDDIVLRIDPAREMIECSPMPQEMRSTYFHWLKKRTKSLAAR